MSIVSLNPGPLFNTPGFNQTYTPVPLTASQRDIKERFEKEQFSNRYDWPPESPVAEVYDIQNSPAKMVLLNNRAVPRSASHLRGHTDRVHRRATTPNPDRHTTERYPRTNKERHLACKDSSSPRFVRKPRMEHMLVRFSGKLAKTSEEVPQGGDGDRYVRCASAGPLGHSGEPVCFAARRRRRNLTISMQDNKKLIQVKGNKINASYLRSIAQVYDVTKEKEYKQSQYKNLVLKELLRGFHNGKECEKYLRYLDGPRKRPFGSSDPSKQTAKKTHSPKRDSSADKKTEVKNHSECVKDAKKKKAEKRSVTVEHGEAEQNNETDREKSEKRHQCSAKSPAKELGQKSETPITTNESTANDDTPRPKSDRPKSREKSQIRRKRPDGSAKKGSSIKTVVDRPGKSEEKKSEKPRREEKSTTSRRKISFLNEGTESSPVSRVDYTSSGKDGASRVKRLQSGANKTTDTTTTAPDEPISDDGGSSTDDMETSTLQGPEGTIRPKSRLGNRPLLTDEEYMKWYGIGKDKQHPEEEAPPENNQTSQARYSPGTEKTTDKKVKPEYRNDKGNSLITGVQDTNTKQAPDNLTNNTATHPLSTGHSEERTVESDKSVSSRTVTHVETESDEDDYRNGNASRENNKPEERTTGKTKVGRLETEKTRQNPLQEAEYDPVKDVEVDSKERLSGQDVLSKSAEDLKLEYPPNEQSSLHKTSDQNVISAYGLSDPDMKTTPDSEHWSNNKVVAEKPDEPVENLKLQDNEFFTKNATEEQISSEQYWEIKMREKKLREEQSIKDDINEERKIVSPPANQDSDDAKATTEQTHTFEISKKKEISESKQPNQDTNVEKSSEINQQKVDHTMDKAIEESRIQKEFKAEAEYENSGLEEQTRNENEELETELFDKPSQDTKIEYHEKPEDESKRNDLKEEGENEESNEQSVILKSTVVSFDEEDQGRNDLDESHYDTERKVELDETTAVINPNGDDLNNLQTVPGQEEEAITEADNGKPELAIKTMTHDINSSEYSLSESFNQPAEHFEQMDGTRIKEMDIAQEITTRDNKTSEVHGLNEEMKQEESAERRENVQIDEDEKRREDEDKDAVDADGMKSSESVYGEVSLAWNSKSESNIKTETVAAKMEIEKDDSSEVAADGETTGKSLNSSSAAVLDEEETVAMPGSRISEETAADIDKKSEQAEGYEASSNVMSTADDSVVNTVPSDEEKPKNQEITEDERVERSSSLELGINVKTFGSLQNEDTSVPKNDENHLVNESTESKSSTNSSDSLEIPGSSAEEEHSTNKETGNYSDSDIDRYVSSVKGREGTTRPKSRFGKRQSLPEETHSVTKDEEKRSASFSQSSSEAFHVSSGYVRESELPDMDTGSSFSSIRGDSDHELSTEDKSKSPVISTYQGESKSQRITEPIVTDIFVTSLPADELDPKGLSESDAIEEDRKQTAEVEELEGNLQSELAGEAQKYSLSLLRSVLGEDTDHAPITADPEEETALESRRKMTSYGPDKEISINGVASSGRPTNVLKQNIRDKSDQSEET